MSLIPRDAASLPETSDQQPSSSAIVLDALPYVEPLDPHYERQAISLIEAELANTAAMEEEEMTRMHPSLQQRPGSIAASDDNDVGLKNAPLARSMYQSIVERLQSSNNNDDGQPAAVAPTVEWEHPIPFHENELSSFENNNNDTQTTTTLSNHLRTSIRSSKILYELHRLHYTNLELQSILTAPSHYQSYHTALQNNYILPQNSLLEKQRLKVDGINATRMEEQTVWYKKLMTLHQMREGLIVKNRKLDGAIEELSKEVMELEGEEGR